MLMQMIHILQQTRLPTHNNIVNRADMLCILGQANTARMRDDRDPELAGQEEDG